MDERIQEIETRLLTGLNYTGCQKDASYLLSIITSLQAENKKYKEAYEESLNLFASQEMYDSMKYIELISNGLDKDSAWRKVHSAIREE